ncbi:MAG: nucleotidyl transferase AbiEii/AbiGii toxin family protein [Nanoarchaeota archaeon]
MRFYADYLKKEEIMSRTQKYGFPQPWLVELMVYDFEVFRRLLQFSKKFVLKGGAAAQMYIPVEQQRASIDIDLITGLTPQEIEHIFMEKLAGTGDFAKIISYKPKNAKNAIPLVTYLIDFPSAVKEGQMMQLKVDILFEEVGSYKVSNIGDKELFAAKIEDKIPCIKLGSLVADKLLTLASKSIGIEESRQDQLPKQVYDLLHLIGSMKKTDYRDMLFSFERIAKAEMKFRGLEHNIGEIISHIDEALAEFAEADIVQGRMKKLINDFQSAYVNRKSRVGLQEWCIGALKLKYLLKTIKFALITGGSKCEPYTLFKQCEHELNKIKTMNMPQKIALREHLTARAQKELTNWKVLKGKSEERLFLELLQKEK